MKQAKLKKIIFLKKEKSLEIVLKAYGKKETFKKIYLKLIKNSKSLSYLNLN